VVKVYVLFFAFICSLPLFAYIDPGTGSYVIQVLIGTGITGIFIIKSQWKRLLAFIRKRHIKPDEPNA